MSEPVIPPPPPGALSGKTPTAKFLWLYLRLKGPVSYSTRKLAAAADKRRNTRLIHRKWSSYLWKKLF